MEPLRLPRLDIPRLITFVFFILCGLAFILYLGFQARHLIRGPIITLDQSLPQTSAERFVTVTGTTANIVAITLNGRPIFTDERGHFAETILLEEGYSIITILAEDRFGRERIVKHSDI